MFVFNYHHSYTVFLMQLNWDPKKPDNLCPVNHCLVPPESSSSLRSTQTMNWFPLPRAAPRTLHYMPARRLVRSTWRKITVSYKHGRTCTRARNATNIRWELLRSSDHVEQYSLGIIIVRCQEACRRRYIRQSKTSSMITKCWCFL